ncbi:MAG: hypothetical protein K9M98_11945 [Cephaloticoccus sp.]|nr:hypothetical protein [Cephaloticoccus sp.]MCF7761205.1 hypothetical protein [Cephaloticoccus sp.]
MGAFLGLAVGLQAQDEVKPTATNEEKASDDDLRIKGVFDSALPGTEKKNRLKLIVHPHFGDFHRKDFLRVPLGLRYGLTHRWEVTGEAEGYFSHGLGSEAFFNSYGFSSVHFGTKYRIGYDLFPGWDMGVGLDYIRPVGNPPTDLSDGLKHFSYFATFSRDLVSRPDWRIFWSVGSDNVSQTDLPVVLDKNELGDDSLNVSGGFVWQRKALSYTLELSYASTRLTGIIDRDVFSVRPGIVWKVPSRYTFNSKGQWLLGLGTRVSYGSDGTDYGVSGKLRVSFDFKKWWRSKFPKQAK